jgi:hypothetical protein
MYILYVHTYILYVHIRYVHTYILCTYIYVHMCLHITIGDLSNLQNPFNLYVSTVLNLG